MYVLFNYSILDTPGRWLGDNGRLSEMEPRLWSERFPPRVGHELGTDISVDQHLTC